MVLAILIRNVAFATQSCRETEMLGHSPSGTRFHFLISLAAHLKWSFHQANLGHRRESIGCSLSASYSPCFY